MTQDFRHVDDLHDFIADLAHDVAARLEEDGIHHEMTLVRRIVRGGPGIDFGFGSVSAYGYDEIEFVTARRIRAAVLRGAVAVARRQRRERAIGHVGQRFFGLLPARPANPLWSCHADLLVLSAFLAKGYDASQLALLGPGTKEPDRSLDDKARLIRPETIVTAEHPIGEGPFHQHHVRDGYVEAHVSIGNEDRSAGRSCYGPLEILSDHRSAVSIHGFDLPETVLSTLPGQPLDALLSHPVTDRVPGLRILDAHGPGDAKANVFVTLERRRTFLAEAPAGTDLSFAELGNDLLAEAGETPVTVLPYSPDLHLSNP